MAITKEVNIVVKETGLDQVQKQVNKLDNSLENLSDTNKGVAKSMGESSQSVLDNGGAMGLLNDATGGLAMTVKDAVEASWLFTKSQKAASIMTAIQTTVIGTSTGAMKAFRIALASTGIGLIVIGLGLLIANFDKVKKVVLNLVPGLSLVGDFITGIVESITDFIGVTSEAERALAELTAQADKSLAMNKKFMAEQGDVLNEYTKQKIDAKNRYLEAVKEEGADQKALAERLNRELLAIDKQHNDDLAKTRKEKQDKIDANDKEASDKRKAKTLKEQEEEKKRLEDEAKAKLDIEMQSAKDAISIIDELKKNVETPAQKEQREFEEKKAILEANNLSTEELEVQHIDAMTAILEEERKKKEEKDLEYWSSESEKSLKRDADEKERDEKKKADKLAQEQALQSGLTMIAESTASIFDNLEALGLKKSKAAVAIRKGIALAQIAADTGKAFSSAVPMAIDAGKGAASVGGPFAGVLGAIATAASYAGSVAMITSNVARAKSLLSGGGSGGGGGSTGGGGGSMPSAPSFNLVQGTSSNQIASSINTQQPIEAFVVSKNVSTGQELDRNIIKSASL